MIDLDAIEKECQQMIADGLGFIAPKSCGNAEMVAELVVELRKHQNDAARFQWMKDNGRFGIGRNGVDWDLSFSGVAPDNSGLIEQHIEEAMKCER